MKRNLSLSGQAPSPTPNRGKSRRRQEELYMSMIKMLAFSILAAGLMVGADRVYAQSGTGMREPPANK
jgi:hypothetical protein